MKSGKKGNDNEYGIWTDNGGKITKNGLDMLVTRYAAPKTSEEKDQIEECPFEDILKDLDSFDMGNTTAFDVTMAEIMLEYGLKQIHYTNATDSSAIGLMNMANEIFAPRN